MARRHRAPVSNLGSASVALAAVTAMLMVAKRNGTVARSSPMSPDRHDPDRQGWNDAVERRKNERLAARAAGQKSKEQKQ